LAGALLGAVVINFAKTWLTGSVPEAWLYVLGAIFVLVTLAFPRGLLGLGAQLRPLRRRRPPPATAAVPGEETAP